MKRGVLEPGDRVHIHEPMDLTLHQLTGTVVEVEGKCARIQLDRQPISFASNRPCWFVLDQVRLLGE